MWDVNNHGDWGLITQQSTASSVVGNSMAVDNEMSVCSMLTNTTINHGYRCPINKSLLQKELELPQSYYVVHRYKLHKHTQQSSGDNIYNNNGRGCNIIHNNQKGESYSVENVHHIWQSVFSMRTNTEYNNQPRVSIPNQQRTAFSSKCGIGKN